MRRHFQTCLIVGTIAWHLAQGRVGAACVCVWGRSIHPSWEEDWLLCAMVERKLMHFVLLPVLSKLPAPLGSCLGLQNPFFGGMNMSCSLDSMEFSAIWHLLFSLQIPKEEATFLILSGNLLDSVFYSLAGLIDLLKQLLGWNITTMELAWAFCIWSCWTQP